MPETGTIPDELVRMTLFCDATHQLHTKAAAWGAWAIRRPWTKGLFFGGHFVTAMESTNDAELCGIANAVYILHTEGNLDGIKKLMIQCDNLMALQLIKFFVKGSVSVFSKDTQIYELSPKSAAGHYNGVREKALDKLSSICAELDLLLELRHVKGHHRDRAGRYWVNQQCDYIATQAIVNSPFFVDTRAQQKKRNRRR